MLIPDKVLHNDVQKHVRRLAVRSSAHIKALDDLVRLLDDGGIWEKIHCLCLASGSSADSLLNIKDGYSDSILVGAPVHVAYQGFTTVSTTAVIDTQILLDETYQYDIFMGGYMRSAYVSGGYMGEVTSWAVPLAIEGVAAGSPYVAIHSRLQAVAYSVAPPTLTSGGSFSATRDNSSETTAAADASSSTDTRFTYGIAGNVFGNVMVGCLYNVSTAALITPAAGQYGAWAVGYGLDPSQLLVFNAALQDYFTALGTEV